VSVLDTAALSIVTTIDVGLMPQESAVSPNGRKLFVVHQAPPYVTVIAHLPCGLGEVLS
jgi:DNA-binding beta-propeller fold protein YncE